MVSTESDESTPREQRYRGGGINDVYDFVFGYTQQAAAMSMIAINVNDLYVITIRHQQ